MQCPKKKPPVVKSPADARSRAAPILTPRSPREGAGPKRLKGNTRTYRNSANNATITPICPTQKRNIHRTRLAYRSLITTFKPAATSVIR